MMSGSPEITKKVAELNESLKTLEVVQKTWLQHWHDCEIYFGPVCDIISSEQEVKGPTNVTPGGERN